MDEIDPIAGIRCKVEMHLLTPSHISDLDLPISEYRWEDALRFSMDLGHIRDSYALYLTAKWGIPPDGDDTLVGDDEGIEDIREDIQDDE